MNLNTAAGRIHTAASYGIDLACVLKSDHDPQMDRDLVDLAIERISELDPTPITEEWLRANGWSLDAGVYCNDSFELTSSDDVTWYLVELVSDSENTIKTLGELRTLLRLMGGGE